MSNMDKMGVNTAKQLPKRIEYIDAMRGFTIFLVVMTHVTIFGLGFYGSDTFSYREIAESFYMPLFFFISGFVLYKAGMEWSLCWL